MGITEEREPTLQASGFSRFRLEDVRSCLASGGEQHVVARVGQFLRIMGRLVEVGLLCELQGQDGGIAETVQEDAGEEEDEVGLMQTADCRRRTEEAGTSSRAGPTTAPSSRGMQEGELTPVDLAIMAHAKLMKRGKGSVTCGPTPNKNSCRRPSFSFKK